MKQIHAIYENGVFRPLDSVDLPNHTKVEFIPRPVDDSGNAEDLDAIYAVLSDSFETDSSDLAARHNDHQP